MGKSNIEIVSTIVNGNFQLIGLRIRVNGNLETYDINQLMNLGLNNHQIKIDRTGIETKNNFSLYNLPMEVYMKNTNTFEPVNNNITVVGRENNGTEDTAYMVQTGSGHKAVVTIEMLKNLNSLFKPTNFVVNTRSDTGKVYLTSKPGCPKISDLPIVGGIAAQLKTRTYKAAVETPNGALSFWNLTNTISTMNGVYIKLPNVKYNADTRMVVPSESAGKVQDISEYGEFALPEFEVVTSNANLNLSFRAAVKVDIKDINGNKMFDIWSNKISTKTVYKNGKANMSNIGILVKNTVKDQLAAVLAGYKWGVLEDAKLRSFYAKTANMDPSKVMIIWLSLENIPAFSANDIATFKNNLPSIDQFVEDIFNYTCIKKALSAFSKTKKEAIVAGNGVKTVSPELAHLTEEQLKAVAEAGIDTTYNSYTFKAEKTADSEDNKDTKSNFAIKWEFTKLKDVNVAANNKLEADVNDLNMALKDFYDNGKIDEANNFIKQTKDSANIYGKKIQVWNFVMLYNGNFEYVKIPSGVIATPSKSNTYLVINTGKQPFEQARAVISGWAVK